jgi:Ca-activated chloride channel homolog
MPHRLSVIAILMAIWCLSCDTKPRAQAEPSEPSAAPKAAAAPSSDTLQLIFSYGSEKEAWIKQVTEGFNRAQTRAPNGKPIQVQAIPLGSGECIDEILQETRKTDIASPASAAFITLGNAQSRSKTGKDLIGKTDSLVLSPVVIAMWRPMAEALGWPQKPIGWREILELSQKPDGWASRGHPEWGAFRFGHTHPESSNSGLISILAEAYAATGKKARLESADIAKPEVARFMRGIENSVVHYGSSTGFFGKKMFANGPRYLSAAVLYENMVIEANSGAQPLVFPVVAVYPREGTFWSDHPIGIVERDWVTPDRRAAAKLYIDYLLGKEQQLQAIPFGFRPGLAEIPLAAPIDAEHGVDPSEPKTTLEVPGADVMHAVLELWKANKKASNLTLVFDVSGSMQQDNRIEGARDGALQFISLLHDADVFALMTFSDKSGWGVQRSALAKNRQQAERTIRGLFPQGGTALYDSISEAYRAQLETTDPQQGLISALVVLTDGADTDSKTTLEQLLAQIRFDNEHHVTRVFTIGYGKDARSDVLTQIADATQAKFYQGDPRNIRAILREISTFF